MVVWKKKASVYMKLVTSEFEEWVTFDDIIIWAKLSSA